nr:hypothetical protein [Treponema sp.]
MIKQPLHSGYEALELKMKKQSFLWKINLKDNWRGTMIKKVENLSSAQLKHIRQVVGEAFVSNEL